MHQKTIFVRRESPMLGPIVVAAVAILGGVAVVLAMLAGYSVS